MELTKEQEANVRKELDDEFDAADDKEKFLTDLINEVYKGEE